MAQVLFADGFAVEFLLEEGPDFLEAIEPEEDLGAGFGAFEAGVEFFANFAGELGDFALARVHSFRGFVE